MNRLELIQRLSAHMTTEKEAKIAVCKTFEIISEALRENKKVVISNFGTFKVKERLPRQMRNPKTNEKVMVKEIRRSIRFKPAKNLVFNDDNL